MAAICLHTKKNRREPKQTQKRTLAVAAAALLLEAALTSGNPGGIPYGHPVGEPIPLPPQNREPPPLPVGFIQGRYGYLPAPMSAMTGFMDRTFELRLELAQTAARERQEIELRRLPQTLAQLWKDPASSSAERRAKILELWADLEVDPAPHRDEVLA